MRLKVRTLFRKLWYKVRNPVSNFWYWIRSRWLERHHIVDCRSEVFNYKWGYQEPSELILYACVNLLFDFVENNRPFDKVPGVYEESLWYHYSWEDDRSEYTLERTMKDHSTDDKKWAKQLLDVNLGQHLVGQEIKELYLWWKFEYRKLDEEIHKLLHNSSRTGNKKAQANWKKWLSMNESFEKLTEKNLHKIIDLRENFWT